MHARHRTRGFTLIEVLVALAVIAIGLLAVLAVGARSGRVAAGLQERTFADWVANNEITRVRASRKWPGVGESDGKSTLAGRDWHWHATVDGTADPDLRRITVTVSPADDHDDTLTQLVGFIGKPSAHPTGRPSGAGQKTDQKPGNNPGGKSGG